MPTPSYLELIKKSKKLIDNPRQLPEVRIAVLGDNSTQYFVQILSALADGAGYYANIYEAEFNIIEQEVINPKSGLYQFKPDFVILSISTQGLRDIYYADPENFADVQKGRIEHWWKTLNTKLQCRIIHHLCVLPLERPYGNFTSKVQSSFLSQVNELNQFIKQLARQYSNVFINDVDYLAGLEGKKNWLDEKLWVSAKMAHHPEKLPALANADMQIIGAALGKMIKCVALDLDNTLWGGIIAEDGLEGLEVGREGIGEAYLGFQRFLLELKNRGIILAVCSKNDESNAMLPFKNHPDMVLKEEDIACFVANWKPKSENLRNIAKTLNIGLDSILFIDDSAFERNEVRQALPQVCVPEMPEDPSEFVQFLSINNYFETSGVSEEDALRTKHYREESKRSSEREQFSNIDEYLQGLQMTASFSRFDHFHLPRIVQLIGRSNQFNLTTRRYSEKECEGFLLNTKDYFPVFITLEDKFGDNGLISIIILKTEGKKLIIDLWLMSCRVLLRGVEQFAMNHVVAYAKEKGCTEIQGQYIPTAKNKMVESFYGQFGFKCNDKKTDGSTTWTLRVNDYKEQVAFIKKKEEKPCPAKV